MTLTQELLTELPGILNWSLDGLAQLATEGHFTEPTSSGDAVRALQELTSPVSAFVRDRCAHGGEVPCDDLYKAWRVWADDNGHKPGSAQSFGRDLRAAIPGLRTYRPREEGTQRRHYIGVSLSTDNSELGRVSSRLRKGETQ